MRSLKLIFISLFIITILSLLSSNVFAVIWPPFTTFPTTTTVAPGLTPLVAPTLAFTPTVPTTVGGLAFWPTALLAPTVAPTLPLTGTTFPGAMWWSLTPTFTPTIPTIAPIVPTFTPVITPTVAPTIPTFTPTVAPTLPVTPLIPVAPAVPLVTTTPAPLTVPLGWPTGAFAPTIVPITGGALWPATAIAPFI